MQLTFNTIDEPKRLSKINLSMPRHMGQNDKRLLGAQPGLPHIICHNRDAPRKFMIITKPLINTLGRMALFLDPGLIILKDLIDNTRKPIKLGANRIVIALIARWHTVLQHLRYRLAVYAKP